METSQPLSIESFSYSWLVNITPSFESFEESCGASTDDLYETSSFIEMDPKLPASRRFSGGSRDFNFDFPTSDSPVTLVHADELISNGFLMPRFGKPKKVEPYDDVAYSTPSTPVPSRDQKNTGFDRKVCYSSKPVSSHDQKNTGWDRKVPCSSFRRCTRFSKRILRKSLELFQKFGGRSYGSKTEADDRRKQEENKFICSAPTSPRISVAYSVDNWRRSCDYESSINEAVLHCKRSIGK